MESTFVVTAKEIAVSSTASVDVVWTVRALTSCFAVLDTHAHGLSDADTRSRQCIL